MLFHAPTSEPDIHASCAIAAWNAVLTAETLGLGSLYNGLLPDGTNRSDRARQMVGLPPGRAIYAGISIGYPRFNLKKTVRRRLEEVRFL